MHGLDVFQRDGGRVEMCAVSTMDSEQRIIQVISDAVGHQKAGVGEHGAEEESWN